MIETFMFAMMGNPFIKQNIGHRSKKKEGKLVIRYTKRSEHFDWEIQDSIFNNSTNLKDMQKTGVTLNIDKWSHADVLVLRLVDQLAVFE